VGVAEAGLTDNDVDARPSERLRERPKLGHQIPLSPHDCRPVQRHTLREGAEARGVRDEPVNPS
jgi:hypothetical protein